VIRIANPKLPAQFAIVRDVVVLNVVAIEFALKPARYLLDI